MRITMVLLAALLFAGCSSVPTEQDVRAYYARKAAEDRAATKERPPDDTARGPGTAVRVGVDVAYVALRLTEAVVLHR